MPLNPSFKNVYGPWAVITGASSGIGAEFSRQLAAAGLNVALVARRADRLSTLARALTAEHGVRTREIVCDLSTLPGVAAACKATTNLDVGLLVNNAGVLNGGAFGALDACTHSATIDINVTASTMLAHEFTRRFVARNRAAAMSASSSQKQRRSGIVMLSSLGRTMMPYHAVYSASKAYMRALALSMRGELDGERVDVQSLEPGVVQSEMADEIIRNADSEKMKSGSLTAEQCVREALDAFEKGKACITPGRSASFSGFKDMFLAPDVIAARKAKVLSKNMPRNLLEYPSPKSGGKL